MLERLTAARKVEDWGACREVLAEARHWVQTTGGVVSSRMVAFWERLA